MQISFHFTDIHKISLTFIICQYHHDHVNNLQDLVSTFSTLHDQIRCYNPRLNCDKGETQAEPRGKTQAEPRGKTQVEPRGKTQAEPQGKTQAVP